MEFLIYCSTDMDIIPEVPTTPQGPTNLEIKPKESTEVEWWRVGYGNYRTEQAVGIKTFGRVEQEEASIEGFLSFSISRLLSDRAKNTSEQTKAPVIIMDFGSTQAHSMVRLAKKFEQQIASGELILVCTNLTHQPNKEEEAKVFDVYEGSVAQVNEDAVPGYYDAAKLINWINGRAQTIADQSVKDGKGKAWLLKGNVALIHENSVFQHVREDKESPGFTPGQKVQQAINSLESLFLEDGLLISTDMDESLGQPIPEQELFSARKVRFKGKGLGIISDYQRYIAKILLPRARHTIEELHKQISNNIIPEGYHKSDLKMLNGTRTKRLDRLQRFIIFAESDADKS